jgi:hypothetical protein
VTVAVLSGPGEGKLLLKDRWWLPLSGADTPGNLAIMEAVLPPWGTRYATSSPSPH